jgi:hypothetical protein
VLRLDPEDRFPIAFAAADADGDVPPVIAAAQQQLRPLWCWAACASMILSQDQCQIAQEVLGPSTACCNLGFIPPSVLEGEGFEPTPCDRTLPDAQISQMWKDRGVPAEPKGQRLSEPELLEALRNQRPVLVQQGSLKRHVLLVVGRKLDKFLIADPYLPDTGFSPIGYDDLVIFRDGWKKTWILR